MTFDQIIEKALSFLRVRGPVGGLEVADTALRFAMFGEGGWRTTSLRLPPGIVEGGKVNDYAEFIEALATLRAQIMGEKGDHRRVGVVVSLSSVNVYSQVFSLPLIEGENLEKAIQLNIQMVSPGATAETYSGWQLVNRDQRSLQLEILSSFVNRKAVDEIIRGLQEAGFVVYAVESRALALTRLIRELGEGFEREGSYLALNLDASGLEILVIRRGQLYFQYFTPWSDLQGGGREISWPVFEAAVVRSVHQVLNFYNSHWTDPVREIYLVASGLEEGVEKVIRDNFSLRVRALGLKTGGAVSPEWFVSVGSGLRGLVPRRDDRDISLLGISAREEYERHQILSFARFWSIVVPVSLSILLAAFLGADVLLIRTAKSLKAQSANVGAVTKEVADLQAQAKEFNRAVAVIGKIQGSSHASLTVLETLNTLIQTYSVTLNRLSLPPAGGPVTLTGEARSESNILGLKKALDDDPQFQSVTLPLAEIRPTPGGLSFSMSFSVVAPKTP